MILLGRTDTKRTSLNPPSGRWGRIRRVSENCGGKVLPTSGFGGIGVWRVVVRATLDTSSR